VTSAKAGSRIQWALMTGNFVIGTGVMVVPGTLSDISESLHVSVPVTGQLITVAAVVMGLGAPVMAAVVARWDRRRLLALSMLWFAAMSGLCALTNDFASLLILRALAVLTPAVFTPQAAACIGMLVPPEQRGRSITFIFLGWSFASVIGMPLGAWLGGMFGWRAAFVAIAIMALFSAIWVWRAMPDGVKPAALSLQAWRDTLRSPALMLVVAVTLVSAFGQFVLFSYFAPYYKAVLGAGPGTLTLLFFSFGAFGLLGNLLMTRHIDRLGSGLSVTIALALMALSLLLWPLGTGAFTAALVAIPWALGCFSSNSAQQARLAVAAPALAGATIALNTSAIYSGQALGAATGGWMIGQGLMGQLHWIGLGIMLLSMAISVLASSVRPHR
jgi:predicted MFS family arabinose efflux permease